MFENKISPPWHLTVNRICDNNFASAAKIWGFSNEVVKRVVCKQHMLFSYAWVECLSPKHKPTSSTFDILFCWWCATNTLHLTVPAGWEGWGLHQPPRVQNRPSHRVQTEIVSVLHTPPKLVIKHICSHPHNAIHEKNPINLSPSLLTDCSAFKACHPKIKSFFFATDCLEEMNRWASGWVLVT